MASETFLSQTGQTKKLVTCSVALAGAMWVNHRVHSDTHAATVDALIWIGSLSVAVGAFAAMCVTIKCPQCHTRLFWRAVSKMPVQRWANELWTATECPICHYKP